MWIVWVLFVVSCLIVCALSALFIYFFWRRSTEPPTEDGKASAFVPLCVGFVSLSSSLCIAVLIPIDVLSVSMSMDNDGNRTIDDDQLESMQLAIQILYYFLYAIIIFSVIVFFPFAHLYYEETGPNWMSRTLKTCRLSVISLFIILAIFIVGAIIPGSDSITDLSNDLQSSGKVQLQEYIVELFDTASLFALCLDFVIAFFTLISFIVFVTYCSYGYSLLPFSLLKGKKHIDEERYEVEIELENVLNRKEEFQKERRAGAVMGDEDRVILTELEEEERNLKLKQRALEEEREKVGSSSVWRPILILFGAIFFFMSLFMLLCIVLSTFLRLQSDDTTECWPACGIVTIKTEFFNPLDMSLTALSPYFPLDFLLFSSLIGFSLLGTLFALCSVGVHLCCLYLYRVEKGRTNPQGVLWACVFLSLCVIALSFEMIYLAPHYTSWGSQVYESDGKIIPCDPAGAMVLGEGDDNDNKKGSCVMSRFAVMFVLVQLRIPFFDFVFTMANVLFLAFWLVGFCISSCKGRESATETPEDDDEIIIH